MKTMVATLMASLMPSQLRNNVSASHIWRALKPYWVCVAPTVSRVIVTLCPNDSSTLQQYIVLLNLGHWSLLNVTIGGGEASTRSSAPRHQFMLEQMGSYCIAAYMPPQLSPSMHLWADAHDYWLSPRPIQVYSRQRPGLSRQCP